MLAYINEQQRQKDGPEGRLSQHPSVGTPRLQEGVRQEEKRKEEGQGSPSYPVSRGEQTSTEERIPGLTDREEVDSERLGLDGRCQKLPWSVQSPVRGGDERYQLAHEQFLGLQQHSVG